MSVEHPVGDIPELVRRDISARFQNLRELRRERRTEFTEAKVDKHSILARIKHHTYYGAKRGYNFIESLYLGTYLAAEDGILAGIYTSVDKHAGSYSAALATTLATYWINRGGVAAYQKKVVNKPSEPDGSDEVKKPLDELYLSAKAFKKVGIKPHTVETLILGSYYGAEQEQREIERTNSQLRAQGLPVIPVDQSKIGRRHSRLFTYEIGGMAMGTAFLGERFVPVEHVTETILNPKLLIPTMLGIYAKRYVDGLRGKVRTESTKPYAIFNKLTKGHRKNVGAKEDISANESMPSRVSPPQPPNEMPRQIDTRGTLTEEI